MILETWSTAGGRFSVQLTRKVSRVDSSVYFTVDTLTHGEIRGRAIVNTLEDARARLAIEIRDAVLDGIHYKQRSN